MRRSVVMLVLAAVSLDRGGVGALSGPLIGGHPMKRVMVMLALAALAAPPAAAQWAGMPVWNSPKGGTGVTFSGDFGKPSDDARQGTAWGARGSVGLGSLTVTAGVATWEPEGFNESTTSFGGTAAFTVIGGSLIPVALNVQAGAAGSGRITAGTATLPKSTTITGAVGLSTALPTPGFSIEPYFSPGLRYHKFFDVTAGQDRSETNFGFTIGADLGLGLLGIHLAYDSEKFDDGTTHGVFGIGAHIGLRAPIGM